MLQKHLPLLQTGGSTVFNHLQRTVGSLAGLVKLSNPRPNLMWLDTKDFTALSLYRQRITLAQYRSTVQGIVEDFIKTGNDLFYGLPEALRNINLDTLRDDHDFALAGHTLTSDKGNTDLYHDIRDRLIQHFYTIKEDGRRVWATRHVTESGGVEFKWCPVKAKEFLKLMAKFRLLAGILVFVLNLPPRGEEVLTCLIADTQTAQRSLIWFAPLKQFIVTLRCEILCFYHYHMLTRPQLS